MVYEAERNSVVLAGKRLVESGLIARTWGNVSCRIDENYFAVTPSGRSYETLLPAEIVIVDIRDLSYKGEIKPSSETRIHGAVYRLKKDVNFIIHTHQTNASVISALGDCLTVKKDKDDSEKKLTFAAYGLPGSKKLCQGVATALKQSNSKTIIMRHHGALCMGRDAKEAFEEALKLEEVCQNLLSPEEPHSPPEESKTSLLIEKDFCEAIIKNRRDIHYVLHATSPEILKASTFGRTLRPPLDDMAQIVGTSLKTSDWYENDMDKTTVEIIKALKGRHGMLIKDRGAFCCGATKKDAEAVQLIMEKGCKASNILRTKTGDKGISGIECFLMRINYLANYSKKAEKASMKTPLK